MTFSAFDNMTSTGKNLFPQQKINGTCDFETIPADNLKIEIPINKISATYNKDNKVNKLVTVFAVSPCPYDSFVP
jgi:chitinase